MAITADFFAWGKSLKNDGDIYFMHDEDAALLTRSLDGDLFDKTPAGIVQQKPVSEMNCRLADKKIV